MKNKIDLSIIIVNYNTFSLTQQCINSIVTETKTINYEIIVVDNASSEKKTEELLTISPLVQLIKNKNNLGFGIANNIGMKASKGDYILLLNSDTIIIDAGIDKSFQFISSSTEIDVLTCRQLNEDRKPFVPASFYFKDNSIFTYLAGNPIQQLIKSKLNKSFFKELKKSTYVNSLSGAFMLLKKDVFNVTKGFDPDFFMYYEETEWCMRINKRFKQFYLHDVSFIHFHGKSAERDLMQKQMILSQGLFWYKSGYLKYIFFILSTYLFFIPSWLILRIFSIKKSSRLHFSKYIKLYFALLPYFTFTIPNSKKSYESRKEFLKLKEI